MIRVSAMPPHGSTSDVYGPAMGAVPRTLAEINAVWLSDQLELSITAVEVDEIGVGEGFMGQLARVRLESLDAGAPASVIVKLPTSDPGGLFIGEMMRVWEREHCFYRDVAPHMEIRIPAALVNLADPPCLVLEDLAPAVVGDHVAGATLSQAERSMDALALHHATWFEHPLLPTLDWMPGLDDPSILTLRDTFAMGWPLFLERFADELPERCLRWCERFVESIPAWIESHYDEPVTLTHGDFRLDNLFFADDGSVAVIDWQLSMRAPGQADFVYFCANNLTVDMRRAHEDDLLARYVAGTACPWCAERCGHGRLGATGLPRRVGVLCGVVRCKPADDRPGQPAWGGAVRDAGTEDLRGSRGPRCGPRTRLRHRRMRQASRLFGLATPSAGILLCPEASRKPPSVRDGE